MLSVYIPQGTSLVRQPVGSDEAIPDNAAWIDLVSPTMAEDKLTERALGIAVPTREEMQEIEVTSRLYVENGARYMTARSEEHTSELQSRENLVCRLLLE